MFEDIDDIDESLAFQPLYPLSTWRPSAAKRREARSDSRASSRLLTPTRFCRLARLLGMRRLGRDGAGKSGGGKDGDGEKKGGKKVARMDEARLLGPTGFPVLIKTTKEFVPKGKGMRCVLYNLLISDILFTGRDTHRWRPEQITPGLPVLDAQNVSEDAVQRYSRPRREVVSFKEDARMSPISSLTHEQIKYRL